LWVILRLELRSGHLPPRKNAVHRFERHHSATLEVKMSGNRTILGREVHFFPPSSADDRGMQTNAPHPGSNPPALSTGPDSFGNLCNRRQLARYLNVTERTVAAWDLSGRIPAIRIGRTVRYDRTEVLRWLQRN